MTERVFDDQIVIFQRLRRGTEFDRSPAAGEFAIRGCSRKGSCHAARASAHVGGGGVEGHLFSGRRVEAEQ